MKQATTIGVYDFDPGTFLAALRRADVRQVLDVRQRRAVRGRAYAWANARRLQALLADAGIEYRHHRELAPTTELRHLQYAADALQGVGKRSRIELADEYRRRYTAEILNNVDLAGIVDAMPTQGRAALLCVEREPSACHRSLIGQLLADEYHVAITHLMPDSL
jgi:uncharacterized protein (DUF488 family)